MFSFEIIENNNKKWDEIIKKSDTFDFHHTAFFHKIDTSFKTQLLYFSYKESFIALPIVIRPINNTDFFDVTSVYGYAGPVFLFQNKIEREKLITFFQEEFKIFCKNQKIVSVFARLHPIIEQCDIVVGLGEIVDLNKTVSIDLTISIDEQKKEYRKSLKSELNQLRRKEFEVAKASSEAEINRFIEIYYETMDRVDANEMYYFSKEYFLEFLQNKSFESELFLAKKDNKIVAGAIFTYSKTIMQYHLAGTTQEFIRETPMKLILDEARLKGSELNMKHLHLGGGVGGSDEDSLFKFKSGFSKNFKQFSVWKYIANEDVYMQLSENKEKNNFFPLYRS